jgi:hypothetical protein
MLTKITFVYGLGASFKIVTAILGVPVAVLQCADVRGPRYKPAGRGFDSQWC